MLAAAQPFGAGQVHQADIHAFKLGRPELQQVFEGTQVLPAELGGGGSAVGLFNNAEEPALRATTKASAKPAVQINAPAGSKIRQRCGCPVAVKEGLRSD